jgi:hypothetical protein
MNEQPVERTRPTARLALGLALVSACAAQQRPPGAATPTAGGPRTPESVLADAVRVTGGAAWHAHKTRRATLTIAFEGMNMGGPAEYFQTDTDKALTVTTLPGVGRVSEGTNGKIFWAQDPVNGLRFLEGAEAEQARIEASWNADLKAHDLYQKLELAQDSPAGLECLVLTPRAGGPIRNCYDRQTHLQVSQEGIRATAQGDVPFRSKESDWREVGGIKMAFSSETQAGPITILTTVDGVVLDEPLPDKMFEPPAPATK